MFRFSLSLLIISIIAVNKYLVNSETENTIHPRAELSKDLRVIMFTWNHRYNFPKNWSEGMTFFFSTGLFTGSFVTLFGVYAVLAHLCGIFSSSSDKSSYVESFYPVFRYILFSCLLSLSVCTLHRLKFSRKEKPV